MANQTIRVPKQGVTAMSRRIAQAVDDQKWQEFRLSMKGKTTLRKLQMLKLYYTRVHKGNHDILDRYSVDMDCDVCIRIDNYIKALCRGGQLGPKESLQSALNVHWHLDVIK